MELEDFSKDEIIMLKRMMAAYGEKKVDLSDAASGILSKECQQRVCAKINDQVKKSNELHDFHDWLKDQ